MSVNKAFLLGNVGADPKFKEFDHGGSVAQFSLATTRKGYRRKDGTEVDDDTQWHNIVAFNGNAKVVSQYVRKGDRLFVEGEIRTRSYDDKNGQTRYVTEIYADRLELLTPKGDGQRKPPAAPAPEPVAPAAAEEDLPF